MPLRVSFRAAAKRLPHRVAYGGVMLDRSEVEAIGFGAIGNNVQISPDARFYNAHNIELGNNVRIDDFCILSAGEKGINIKNFVHIAAHSTLIGRGNITLSDFCNLSSRVAIYSSNDDYSGDSLTNPTVPERFKNVFAASVFLGRHVIVGSGSIVLPGVTLHEGVAVGALSLVKHDCAAFGVYVGTPVKRVRERSRKLLELEKQFLEEFSRS